MTLPYTIINAQQAQVPIIVSVPHCGTQFPIELKDQYKEELIQAPDDTDWFVDQLYDFVPYMGITMITANYSRWVIDLNRDPESKPLYTDGRIITGLCPTTNFLGESIYRDNRNEVDAKEIKRRVDQYYMPYQNKFGKVLLWDCHSIRLFVPTIHKERFPDLILGDADGTSASPGLIETTLKTLEESGYQVSHNYPFKGGYITRHNGRPADNFHALQLEMTKVNYMDDQEMKYDIGRAEKMKVVLEKVFARLIEQLDFKKLK
jgi:N-formylglutamate deformylase